jgi:hypothetical protein
MSDLLDRLRRIPIPGIRQAEINKMPCPFSFHLSVTFKGIAYSSCSFADIEREANEVLKAWIEEQNSHAAALIQELIDPVWVNGRIWAYPDHQAVMPVPVGRSFPSQMRIMSGFGVEYSAMDYDINDFCQFEVELEAAIAFNCLDCRDIPVAPTIQPTSWNEGEYRVSTSTESSPATVLRVQPSSWDESERRIRVQDLMELNESDPNAIQRIASFLGLSPQEVRDRLEAGEQVLFNRFDLMFHHEELA